MFNIKIMTDSACDIPLDIAEELEIQVMPIPIAIDGAEYLETVHFDPPQFYALQLKAKEIPSTSHITTIQFYSEYEKHYSAGYQHVVHVTICSGGSNMHSAAVVAKHAFFEEHPEAKDRFTIDILDSSAYTLAYGYPMVEAAKKIKAGATRQEIVEYLVDCFDRMEIYFSVFTLEFVKKSGRVKAAAAFAGELLGLRPILDITDGHSKTIDKVRGDKMVVPRLAQMMEERPHPQDTPYIIVYGMDRGPADELAAMLTKQLGYGPAMMGHVGASIAINAGPKLVGLLFMGERRERKKPIV